MAWTYTPNGASTSDKDQVRFLIGDTNTDKQLLQDEEINYALDQSSDNIYKAAALSAESIAMKLATYVDERVDVFEVSQTSARANVYYKLAEELSEKAKKNVQLSPYAGGISKSDKETVADDTDRVEPFFKRDLMDNKEWW